MVVTRSGRNAGSSSRSGGAGDDNGRIATRRVAAVDNPAPLTRRRRKRGGNEEGAGARKKRRAGKTAPAHAAREGDNVEPNSRDEPRHSQSRSQSDDPREPAQGSNAETAASETIETGEPVEISPSEQRQPAGGRNIDETVSVATTTEKIVEPSPSEPAEELVESEEAREEAIHGNDSSRAEESARTASIDPAPLQSDRVTTTGAEDTSHHVVYDEIEYHDMNGKKRSFSTALSSFIVPFPETTPPLTLIHFVVLYIIRSEARRIFPREVTISWLMDFFISTWIEKSKDEQPSADVAQKPPLTEHESSSFFPLLKKRYLLLPFFANSWYSLIVIEDLGLLIDLLRTFMELEAVSSATTAPANNSVSLAQRIKKFERVSLLKDIEATAIYHIDWPNSTHEAYRPAIQKFLVHFCFYLLDDLKKSCSVESMTAFLDEHVPLHPISVPDPPDTNHDSAWKVIQYASVMVQGPDFNPSTGKPTICERENLLYSSLGSSACGDLGILRSVADRAVSNMQTAKESPQINPYPGLWGGFFDSLTRDINEPLLISSTINLSNCLPVVLEFSLKALDDLIEDKRSALCDTIKEEGSNKVLEAEDLTGEAKV